MRPDYSTLIVFYFRQYPSPCLLMGVRELHPCATFLFSYMWLCKCVQSEEGHTKRLPVALDYFDYISQVRFK